MNYNYRPNALLAITASRRNSQRLARKFETHPLWPALKYLTLGSALQCQNLNGKLKESLERLQIPDFAADRARTESPPLRNGLEIFNENPAHFFRDDRPGEANDTLVNLSRVFGFYSSDWSLQFRSTGPVETGTNFNTSMYSMQDQVMSVLIRNEASKVAQLKPFDFWSYDMVHTFGPQFMCLDETANSLMLTTRQKESACKVLTALQAQHEKRFNPQTATQTYQPHLQRETREHAPKRPEVNVASVAAGERILTETCAKCHNGDVIKYNFADKTALLKQLEYYRGTFIPMVENKLGTPIKCEMPYSAAGSCLTDLERESVLNFLKQLDATPR